MQLKTAHFVFNLATPEIPFLDFKNYLTPNYSLEVFLKHYGATEAKRSFRYEKVQGVDDLKRHYLPEKDDFFHR